jgi:hypothetical protein
MSSPATTALYDLLEHVDKLKALHRAAESPTFGQVEALFDKAELVRRSVGVPARPAWPTQASPVEQAARRLVELVAAQLAGKGAAA